MMNNLRIANVIGLRKMAMLFLHSLCLSVILSNNQMVSAASTGENLYAVNCAACHKDGHNIINAKKPVIGSAKLADESTFKEYLLKPTGAMAPYPTIANNNSDLTALYKYCKSLK